jgi:hypothetical protein
MRESGWMPHGLGRWLRKRWVEIRLERGLDMLNSEVWSLKEITSGFVLPSLYNTYGVLGEVEEVSGGYVS